MVIPKRAYDEEQAELGTSVTTSVLGSYCRRNKSPQTGWLKTAENYPLTVLETGSLKLRCQQG